MNAPEDDLGWLDPPQVTGDPAVWDRYWFDQASHGLGPPLFDLFCDDRALVAWMRSREISTILCVGSGISQEPRALAAAGFKVTALDFSSVAMELARTFELTSAGLEHFIDDSMRRPGGRVDYVVGDFLDPTCCPGPFDAVIERRSLQSLPADERARALQAVVRRLTEYGLFFSHCHDGAWRPPVEPRHATESWFRDNGWRIRDDSEQPGRRIAWLFTSTG